MKLFLKEEGKEKRRKKKEKNEYEVTVLVRVSNAVTKHHDQKAS